MSTQTPVRVCGLGKRYRIGQRVRYKALRDVLGSALAAPRDWLSGNGSRRQTQDREEFWAIRNVSFDVASGEVVGIIGRNGAGKTTLLRILSRITHPTEGYADICGRVGSLLEVGTGFHPELTGRENIFLNGAILGMKRAETARKFDEIVAFAETDRFIDTPVKFYSSGMYVRLAFAVAAHLEPEILMVDEVLAVGDIAFQRKCLGKMENVAKDGRTVLFVSHNLAAIQSLCTSGVVLEAGTVAFSGAIKDAVNHYTGLLGSVPEREGTGGGALEVRHRIPAGTRDGIVESGRELTLEFDLHTRVSADVREILFLIRDSEQSLIVRTALQRRDYPDLSVPGRTTIRIKLPALWLRPGIYSYYLKVTTESASTTHRAFSDSVVMQVVDAETSGYELAGVLAPRVEWSTVREDVPVS